jgi:hypothetical protein
MSQQISDEQRANMAANMVDFLLELDGTETPAPEIDP